jgi:hypothetical protein
LDTRKPLHDQRPCWIPVAPAAAGYLAKVRRLTLRKAIQNQSLTSSVLNPRSREVWRQISREREFRVLVGASQCGGLRAKPVVIGLLCALASRRECWSRKGWRRDRNWDPTLSNFCTRFQYHRKAGARDLPPLQRGLDLPSGTLPEYSSSTGAVQDEHQNGGPSTCWQILRCSRLPDNIKRTLSCSDAMGPARPAD